MWTKKPKESPFNSLRVFGNGDKASLKYLRVVATDCNLHSREVSCWEEIKNRFELKSAQMPVCSGYKGIYKYDEESAIAYPVEVRSEERRGGKEWRSRWA